MIEEGIIISVKLDNEYNLDSETELKELCRSIDINIKDIIIQKRRSPDPKYYIGNGKLTEIKSNYKNVSYLIFNQELTPSQIKNIEKETNKKVYTRVDVILKLFEMNARTRTAKLQVKLAELMYKLPRLTKNDRSFSRIEGGIGMRGPGEQQLELDRRNIRRNIDLIKEKLREIDISENNKRKKRLKNEKIVAIAGYTNSGKSSLINALTNSNVYVEDKLFATLDTTTRKLWLVSDNNINGNKVLFVDTVGFIRDIPHILIECFKSTLKDTIYSDLIIHLVDVSVNNIDDIISITESILREINANQKRLLCFNKIDLIDKEKLITLMNKYEDAIFISVKNKIGLNELKNRISEILFSSIQ